MWQEEQIEKSSWQKIQTQDAPEVEYTFQFYCVTLLCTSWKLQGQFTLVTMKLSVKQSYYTFIQNFQRKKYPKHKST